MLGGVKILLPLIFSFFVVLSSGCVNMDPTAFAKTIPMVQDFLSDHPNAEIKIVHYTKTESEGLLDLIKEDCGKLSVEPKEYYFVNITDPDTNLVVRVWIDWETQLVECVYKEGTVIDPENCTSLHKAKCFGDHVYWFDSCGNREEKKEYCPLGCSDGECVSGNVCDAERSYTDKPACVCPDGYEMIVLYPRCADSVTGAITGMPFAVTEAVADKAVTTESGEVDISDDFTPDFESRCPDAKPVYRCVQRRECKSHAQAKCYKGHVFWFDSCGHVQEKKEYCSEGCEQGFCRERKTCEQAGGYCTYPYQACTEEAKQCPDGTAVGRVGPDCEFAPCPGTCDDDSTDEVETCADSVTGMMHDTEASTTETNSGCYDSDGGKSYSQKGYVESVNTKYEDHCNEDGTLTEKYCHDGELAAVKVRCESGYCSNGACVYETPSTSSGGGGGSAYPVCKEGYYKSEYWCPEDGVCCAPAQAECRLQYRHACYDNHVYWFDSCGNRGEKKQYCEHGCLEGACIEEDEQMCLDADGEWKRFNDGCADSCELERQDPIACTEALTWGCDCGPSMCWNGETCEPNEKCAGEGELTSGAVAPEYGCCEGLKSFNPYSILLKGTGMLCYDPEKGVPVCLGAGTDDEGWYYPSENLLAEWECSNESVECTDSDGGLGYYTAGVVELDDERKEDYCSGDVVVEYLCKDGAIKVEDYTCPYGCEDGACLKPGRIATGFTTLGAPDDWSFDEEGDFSILIHNGLDANITVPRIDISTDSEDDYCEPAEPMIIIPGSFYDSSNSGCYLNLGPHTEGDVYSIDVGILYIAGGLNHTETGNVIGTVEIA